MSIQSILDEISALTVIELKELLDAFEEKFGVTAAAPVAVAAVAAGGGAAAAAEEEKDEFDVILDGFDVQQLLYQVLDFYLANPAHPDLKKAKISEVIAETDIKLIQGGDEELNVL